MRESQCSQNHVCYRYVTYHSGVSLGSRFSGFLLVCFSIGRRKLFSFFRGEAGGLNWRVFWSIVLLHLLAGPLDIVEGEADDAGGLY